MHCVGSVPVTSFAFGEEVNGVSGFVRSYERKDGETETFRKRLGQILCVFSFRNFFFRNEHSPVMRFVFSSGISKKGGKRIEKD